MPENVKKTRSYPYPSSFGVNIYIDESGDLGFAGTTDFFVLGAVIAKSESDVREIKKYGRRALKDISNKGYNLDELKSSKLKDYEKRNLVISQLLKSNLDFAYCLLRKNDVNKDDRESSKWYNWLSAKLVEGIIHEYGFKSDVNVIIDKSLNGIRRENFDHCIKARKSDIFNNRENLNINLFHIDSKIDEGIQFADMVAGTVYRHYTYFNCEPQHNDNFFPDICKKTTLALDFFKGRRK